MLKGKDIIKKVYPLDEIRMRAHIDNLKQEKEDTQRFVDKGNNRIVNIDKEIERCENMTLGEWIKEHPPRERNTRK